MSTTEVKKAYNRQQLELRMISALRSSLDKMEFFWREFGISGESKADRAELVVSHIVGILSECEQEEETLYEKVKATIASYVDDLRELSKELDLVPEELGDDLFLIQKEKVLRTQLDELEQIKYNRMKEYKILLKREARLCDMLGMPKTAPLLTVPKKQDLRELEQNIHMLSDERERRYQKFCRAKKELTTIMEVTECSPETSFEREIICFDEEDNFVLSQENLEQISQLVQKYQKRKDEIVEEKKVLTDKLNALWDRLDVDKHEREVFLSNYNELRHASLVAMKEEIERCEEIKKQNIGMYIIKLREELVDLWNKCCIDHRFREHFSAFHCDDFTEDLLEVHEAEVEKLKAYYEDAKEILAMIQKRKELWELMLVFEKKANDQNRFNNRGGILLQEEKQRKKLLRDLPKLEEQILEAIRTYEEENEQLFLVNGVNFAEFIKNQWDEHIKEKENERIERQRQRTLQMEGTNSTPLKRSMLRTPMSAPSKLLRTNVGMSVLKSAGKPNRLLTPKPSTSSPVLLRKMPASTNVVRRVSSRLKQMRSTTPVRKPLAPSNKANDPNATSYSQFAMEMNRYDRNHCRSSVLSTKKKVLGSKISHSGTLRKSSSRSSRKSSSIHSSSSKTPSSKSLKIAPRTPIKFTPARSVMGLPFLT